jgi:GNAT superfamily N-acetyltransferase
MADGVVRVEPLTADRWDDADVVFGTRGDPAGCWCQYFRLPGADFDQRTRGAHRTALRTQAVEDPAAPGLIALRDDVPAGWVAVAPRTGYPRITGHRLIPAVAEPPAMDDEGVWSVTCFVVRVGHRRQGIGRHLLEGAVSFARAQGAAVVEGYPVDTVVRPKASSAELYHGVASTFAACGFEEVGRFAPARPVMRLSL